MPILHYKEDLKIYLNVYFFSLHLLIHKKSYIIILENIRIVIIMSLPVDERLLTAQLNLIKEREKVIAQKRQLLEQFRTFALNKLRTCGQPFKVQFREMNGDPKVSYRDLNIGDEFLLKYGSFTFDPKTGLISDYVRTEIHETKISEDFDELIAVSTKQHRVFRELQNTLENVTDLEKKQIEKSIEKKVDTILVGIFKGELRFSDQEFQQLVNMNIALEKELQELNIRINALKIINSSADVVMTDGNNQSFEPKEKSNRPNILDFLKDSWGVDPSLAVVALSQPEQEEHKRMK